MADRILLVDDDPILLRALSRTLDETFELQVAESGAHALELLRTDGPFCVLVSDMKMPQMDGVELITRVKDQWPEIVSIILTGNQDEESAHRANEIAKVFRLLNKPSPRAELVEAIEEALAEYNRCLAGT